MSSAFNTNVYCQKSQVPKHFGRTVNATVKRLTIETARIKIKQNNVKTRLLINVTHRDFLHATKSACRSGF